VKVNVSVNLIVLTLTLGAVKDPLTFLTLLAANSVAVVDSVVAVDSVTTDLVVIKVNIIAFRGK
jgi:hypothetical protein